jgi:hypothetical protein
MKGVETILARKRERSKNKKVRKHFGGIAAPDEKYTGTEPVWDGWEKWDVEKFWKERSRALFFYNYYSGAKELKPNVTEWMEANGYTNDQVKAVKAAPDYLPGVTISSFCRMLNRGMPGLHPRLQEYIDLMPGLGGTAKCDIEFVRESLGETIRLGMKEVVLAKKQEAQAAADASGTSAPKVVSPMTLLKKKIWATVIMDIDVLMDKWMDTPAGKPIEKIDLFERIRSYGLPAMGLGYLEEWLSRHLNEMSAAAGGEDPDLAEAYSHLNKAQLQERIQAFETMLKDVNRAKHSAKAQRAPREKKPPSSLKQIAKLNYLKDSPEFKITSVNPVRIAGAYRLLAFHVKERLLLDFVAQSAAGLQISGTSLKNLDDKLTRCKRLRKPDQFLPTVLNGTQRQIDNGWEKITTVQSIPPGRINKDMILVRVFEQRD